MVQIKLSVAFILAAAAISPVVTLPLGGIDALSRPRSAPPTQSISQVAAGPQRRTSESDLTKGAKSLTSSTTNSPSHPNSPGRPNSPDHPNPPGHRSPGRRATSLPPIQSSSQVAPGPQRRASESDLNKGAKGLTISTTNSPSRSNSPNSPGHRAPPGRRATSLPPTASKSQVAPGAQTRRRASEPEPDLTKGAKGFTSSTTNSPHPNSPGPGHPNSPDHPNSPGLAPDRRAASLPPTLSNSKPVVTPGLQRSKSESDLTKATRGLTRNSPSTSSHPSSPGQPSSPESSSSSRLQSSSPSSAPESLLVGTPSDPLPFRPLIRVVN